jgi:hypothetical protein
LDPPGFYINLPFGGIALASVLFLLNVPRPEDTKDFTLRQKIERLDPIGTVLSIPGIACLVLALQWGGSKYAWNSWRIILLIVLAGVFLLAFIVSQAILGDKATVPPRIITQRSVASAFWYATCFGAILMIAMYYIPVWFQVVKGTSAVGSGIRLIATVLALVVGSFIGGGITFKSGYYTPTMIISSVVVSVGAGMLSTWEVDSNSARWLGYQVLFGIGLGLGMQQPNMGVQTVLSKKDVAIGSSIIFFATTLSGSIFLSVAQNVFAERLAKGLASLASSPAEAAEWVKAGATNFRDVVPKQLLNAALGKWNDALRGVFYVAVAMAALSMIGALTMEWRTVKRGEGQADKEREEKEKEKAKTDSASETA